MSVYEQVYKNLELCHEEGDFDTPEGFSDIIRQIHNTVEEAAQDYIHDYNREDLEEEYLPMI